ncbi:MAG: AMP-binding protein [Coriobacteriia bacterium]|nr:AMP-binding protein [Coriobacteriia bacterium]MCL2536709.1 AMP-binding protein [Coriobacteriia bacterium]
MDALLKKFCPRIDFDCYEDFHANFSIDIPGDFNFAYDVVDAWAHIEPEKRALHWIDDKEAERFQTFDDIAQMSDQLAAAMTNKLGLVKGDIVLLILRQRWEYWALAVALMKMGVVFVPGSVQMTAKDLAFRAEAAGFKTIIAVDDPYVVQQVEACCAAGADISNKVLVQQAAGVGEDGAAEAAGWTTFDELLTCDVPAWERPSGASATTAEDTLMLYFTSGTTGQPKMVHHTHAHPLGHITTAKYWQQVQEDALHFSVTDSAWAKFGWGKIYGQWICGAGVFAYDWDSFVPARLLEKLQDYDIATFCAPPTMYRFMLQEDVASFDLSSVVNYATAGEPLNAEVTNKWEAFTGKKIREGFGQSESTVMIATWPWLEPRPGSLGKPDPLYNIRLLVEYDPQGEPYLRPREADIGQEGAICVTGLKEGYPPGLFTGYYRCEEKSADALGGSYYNLGDMAWRDIDGYLTFVGRNDDVIKASGYRIGPFEVESALISHPAVVESAVTAAPDPVRGTVVKADVVLAKDFRPSEELVHELQEHVKKVTAPYKYPRIICFVDELPKTLGGKIKRAEIRKKNEDST